MYGVAVGRDHAADEFAEINPKLTRGRAVDDAEADPAAALDAHDLRICGGSVVGEESIVMNIVQTHSHAVRPRHVHSRHAHAGRVGSHAGHAWFRRMAVAFATWAILGRLHYGLCCGYARAGKAGEHLLRRSEGEVVQHENDFLPVFAKLNNIMDDERRGHQALLLHAVMRMHPILAGNRTLVPGSMRGLNRWPGLT